MSLSTDAAPGVNPVVASALKQYAVLKDSMITLMKRHAKSLSHESWTDLSCGGACSRDVGCLPETKIENLFKCCFCAHVVGDQRGILNHLFLRCDERLECQLCPESFSKAEDLSCHTEIHKPERTFDHQLRSASFQKCGHPAYNIRANEGEKPFKCQEGPQAFAQSEGLTTHMEIHVGEQPYRCQQCHNTFASRSYANRHIRINTGEEPYDCELCPVAFTFSGNLKRHVQTHTGERPYKREQCP
ncbi:zinc finger protein 471-like [Ixodes scapularis]|uniref:zinc finger protein 471-like n=1 Tax=Ixodes scapularis TaxID=6945 RepID=UPI001C389B76|nr:zinc finger protein 471-like [Ixodes scapularis]